MTRNLIYALVDSRTKEVRYVGRSSSGLARPKSHMYPCNLIEDSYKTRWIKKNLGHIEIKILEEVTNKNLLDEREIYWISQFSNLVNTQAGGKTGPAVYKYNSTIYQISSDFKTVKKYSSIEEIDNTKFSLAGIRRCLNGTRVKYKRYYWTLDLASIDLNRPTKNKPFVGTSFEGTIMYKFNNLMEAKQAGLHVGNIHSCLSGKRKTSSNCTWRDLR